jgi:predicted MPP superfamily phosphohydrolase
MRPLFTPTLPLERLSHPVRNWTRWLGRNWARLSYGFRIEPTWLELNRVEIPLVGLPRCFDGFRIAQLSDLHCGGHVPVSHVQEAVDLAQRQRPDLVALTGDFVHKGFRHVRSAARAVGRLRAPHGVFAVLGNHDFSVRNALGIRRYRTLHHAIDRALQDQGIRVLRNEALRLPRHNRSIIVGGVDDLWSRCCDLRSTLSGLPKHAPRIILAHNPRTIERLGGERCDLMLSGHTHGGQIDWPGLGRPFLGRRARRFASGLYRHNDTHLYVNKGVGFGFRFRFGVRPEVAVITLRCA